MLAALKGLGSRLVALDPRRYVAKRRLRDRLLEDALKGITAAADDLKTILGPAEPFLKERGDLLSRAARLESTNAETTWKLHDLDIRYGRVRHELDVALATISGLRADVAATKAEADRLRTEKDGLAQRVQCQDAMAGVQKELNAAAAQLRSREKALSARETELGTRLEGLAARQDAVTKAESLVAKTRVAAETELTEARTIREELARILGDGDAQRMRALLERVRFCPGCGLANERRYTRCLNCNHDFNSTSSGGSSIETRAGLASARHLFPTED